MTERDALILDWREMQSQLSRLKHDELALRNQIVEKMFDKETSQGTETLDLGNDYSLKAVKKLNYKIVGKREEIIAKIQSLPVEIQSRLISWKPSLSSAEYKKLSAIQAIAIQEIVEIKPGTPTLTLVVPKA